ncbi:unnamed protein product [Rotaria magnacalcarata]|uniref:Transposase n=2 Tax=Rotaria magnacalcarata TaxID=392030 RepID=A0A8S2LEY5_9BILA|nr:unnamed protein product [Rotaria magnacalcarata]CAF3891266.1 unnamed protein product [Rotaria magnacalcarata]CAF3900095.1 unnamed protein product [Rotaria magnacalcarata]
MAPKKKEYSTDLRTLVIKHFLNGDSQREIAKKTLLSRETVRSMIKKYKSTKCIGNLFGRGRKRKTTATMDRLIQRKLKCNRRKSSRSVTAELQNHLGILISESTVQRRAHEIGLFGRVARKKPYVNKINRIKRLKYAKEMLTKPLGFWDNIVWSDESKFNLFGSDGKIMVWRTRNEEFGPKCTIPTVTYGGGSVMVWGCFTKKGVGKLYVLDHIMDALYYRQILEENLLASVNKLGFDNNFIFMHDNDPKHTSGLVKDWLKKNGIQVLQWPSSSSDLNPIEHLWDALENRMKKHHPKNKEELAMLLVNEWEKIELSVLKTLVSSVPNDINNTLASARFVSSISSTISRSLEYDESSQVNQPSSFDILDFFY